MKEICFNQNKFILNKKIFQKELNEKYHKPKNEFLK
jgi:hypothetical protein